MAYDGYFTGYCPQCQLAGSEVAMMTNGHDWFECPSCHLQIANTSFYAVTVLHYRGKGEFRYTMATEVKWGETVMFGGQEPDEAGKMTFMPAGVGRPISLEEDMRAYLATVIDEFKR